MRRAACLAWLLWLAAVTAAYAQSAAVSLYAEGNQLYRQGRYDAARERYGAAAAAGVADPRLYYNLGNACFKSEHLGEAILWYERALRLDPRDPDIRANLAFARHVKVDRDAPDESPAVWRFAVGLYEYPTTDELAAGFAVLWLASFGLAAWRLRVGPGARGALAAAITCGAITLVAAGWLGQRAAAATRPRAIVTAAQATARSAPEAAETAIFVVHEGTEVQVERREGDWLLIRLANGLGGWLQGDAVTTI
ncbi:MAG: tetratricopeptide repeat protein [Gemmatimonadota bacterium]